MKARVGKFYTLKGIRDSMVRVDHVVFNTSFRIQAYTVRFTVVQDPVGYLANKNCVWNRRIFESQFDLIEIPKLKRLLYEQM